MKETQRVRVWAEVGNGINLSAPYLSEVTKKGVV